VAPTSRDRPAKSDIDPYLDILLSNIAHSKSSNFTPEFAIAAWAMTVSARGSDADLDHPVDQPVGSRSGCVEDPHSITSSARASNVSGKSRPSDFAVLRLTVLKLVKASKTGATKFRENRQKAQ
jgi:hypothetical protein